MKTQKTQDFYDGMAAQRQQDREIFASLDAKIAELEAENAELRKSTLVRFSDFMHKHYKWILGSLALVGGAVAWAVALIYK